MLSKKLTALVCALCILLSSLPLAALAEGDEAEMADAAAQAEIVPEAETDTLTEADADAGEATPSPQSDAAADASEAPSSAPEPQPTPTADGQAVQPEPEAPTEKPQDEATAAPKATPFPFPAQMQILTDRHSVWTGLPVVYTIIGLDEKAVLMLYDPKLSAEGSAPVPLACTPEYPDAYLTIPRMTWNEELKGWQFSYMPEMAGQFQLVWRMYADADLNEWRDYTEANAQDVITAYAPPTVQVSYMDMSAKAGDPIKLVVETSAQVEAVALIDADGNPLPYVDSVTCEQQNGLKRWTCLYRLYEAGTHNIAVRASAWLEYVEKTVDTQTLTVAVLPSETQVPLPTTHGPDTTPDPAPASGYVRFKQVPSADAKVGEKITLNLDVEFAGYDGRRINYTEPEFYNYVDYIEVQPEITADNYPFAIDESLERIIIHSYEEMLATPFSFNVKVKPSLANGAYTFNFTLRYRLKDHEEPEGDKTEAGMVFVTGAKTHSGGGGGGGGGGVPLPPTQAKLIVDSLRTIPENPKAGDKFDILLSLKNTNEKQYVQNIMLTYTTDGDVLMPSNGSSSFYIEKIGANDSYELKIPVMARPDMPDQPIKLNISMNYEDKKVNSLSASQVVIVNVKQIQKLKLDELVQPNDVIMQGDSATFSMNIINSGRTTLYNVSAAMLESEQFTTAGSAYVGNLEAGSSKNIELDIYPNVEGPLEGTLRVTYEDANGRQTNADTPFSIFVSSMQEDDKYFEPEIAPTPEPTNEVGDIVARLPWWVYGAAGLLVICVVMLIAVAVRRHKMDAMLDYDDE